MKRVQAALFALIVAVSGAVVAGESAAVRSRFELPKHGYLEVSVPVGWNAKVEQAKTETLPTITFDAGVGNPFIFTITPTWKAADRNAPRNKEELRQLVRHDADGIRLLAVEKNLKLTEIKGRSGMGYYFFATDPPPAIGYKYMTKGGLLVGNVAVMFTILTNDGQEAIARDGLAMLRGARHVPAGRRAPAK